MCLRHRCPITTVVAQVPKAEWASHVECHAHTSRVHCAETEINLESVPVRSMHARHDLEHDVQEPIVPSPSTMPIYDPKGTH